jgi:hypothetical protein
MQSIQIPLQHQEAAFRLTWRDRRLIDKWMKRIRCVALKFGEVAKGATLFWANQKRISFEYCQKVAVELDQVDAIMKACLWIPEVRLLSAMC